MTVAPMGVSRSSAQDATILIFPKLRDVAQQAPSEDGDPQSIVARVGLTHALISLLIVAEGRLDDDRSAAKLYINRALSLLEAEQRLSRCGMKTPATPARGGLPPWRARRIKQHIDDHLSDTILIEELTVIAGLSVRQFSAAFKQSFGTPPHEYIVRRRIDKAQELMLLTTEPLAQIAVACGFADQAHLSKWFRRYLQAAPNAWRKERSA